MAITVRTTTNPTTMTTTGPPALLPAALLGSAGINIAAPTAQRQPDANAANWSAGVAGAANRLTPRESAARTTSQTCQPARPPSNRAIPAAETRRKRTRSGRVHQGSCRD